MEKTVASETVRQGLTFLESGCSTELLCILLAYQPSTLSRTLVPDARAREMMTVT